MTTVYCVASNDGNTTCPPRLIPSRSSYNFPFIDGYFFDTPTVEWKFYGIKYVHDHIVAYRTIVRNFTQHPDLSWKGGMVLQFFRDLLVKYPNGVWVLCR